MPLFSEAKPNSQATSTNNETAFEQLILSQVHKDTIMSLMTQHFREKQAFKPHEDRLTSFDAKVRLHNIILCEPY
jgi:hypothetical protein